MLIGILSDAHGNIYGLKKCINLLKKYNVDEIYFLGDAINYFSKSKEVLNCLRENKIKAIKGNHERYLTNNIKKTPEQEAVYNLEFTKKELTENDLKFIQSWDNYLEITRGGYKILLVHGSPFNYSEEYVYSDYNFNKFIDLDYDIVFMGHTHIPFIKKINNKYIVNVGSVGLPREDGRFIHCALFDTKEFNIEILKIAFPNQNLKDLRPFHNRLIEILNRRKNE